MKRFELPRIYILKDVIMVRWYKWEWIIRRFV